MSTVFSAVVKPDKPLLYICDEATFITNIAINPISEKSKDLSSIPPFVTVLKLQYEGPVIEGENDSDEDEAKSKKKTESGKKSKNPSKDHEDSDDDSEDADFRGLDFEAKEVVVGCFTPSVLQMTTDLLLSPSDQYRFVLSGCTDYEVHLLGRYLPGSEDETPDEYDSADSDDDEDESDDLNLHDMIAEDEDEVSDEGRMEEIDSDDEQVVEARIKTASKAEGSSKTGGTQKSQESQNSKKRPLDDKSNPPEDTSMESGKADTSAQHLSKSQRKKLKKLKSAEAAGAQEPVSKDNPGKPQAAKPEESRPTSGTKPAAASTVTLPSGLKITDTKIGTGSEAKPGQQVAMRYIGKLTNGKVFDSNTKGKPFTFRLGKGEVIKGWDEGIKGMKLGGERKLLVPANLAYGKSGSPPEIPPNSTLAFDVKLLSVK